MSIRYWIRGFVQEIKKDEEAQVYIRNTALNFFES